MNKTGFYDALDADLSWRKKEVSDLFIIAQTQEHNLVILKSIVLLIYAHWEGFTKRSAVLYLQYVSKKNIKLQSLEKNFHVIHLKESISFLIESSHTASIENEIKFLEKINQKPKFRFPSKEGKKSIIDTESNLSSTIHERIYKIIGISYKDVLRTRKHFIDTYLLKNRHSIAHGDIIEEDEDSEFSLNIKDVEKLKNCIFIILDSFKEELSDYVEHEYYLASKSQDRDTYESQRETLLDKSFQQL